MWSPHRCDPRCKKTVAYAFGVGVRDPRDANWRVLRVVTLSDGETIHNAFFDRGYRDDQR